MNPGYGRGGMRGRGGRMMVRWFCVSYYQHFVFVMIGYRSIMLYCGSTGHIASIVCTVDTPSQLISMQKSWKICATVVGF